MRPIAIDTNAYAAFKRGDDTVLAVLKRASHLLISVTVLGELLAGFAGGNRQAKNREELAEFLSSARVTVLPVTAVTADTYALVFAALRRKGKPIPTNDLWIAASAMEHGAALLTLDGHFAQIDGLRIGVCLEDFLP